MLIIKDMDINHSSNDIIPLSLFKLFPTALVKTLTEIFNKSIQNGVMPDKLKISKIIPVFKKGSRSDPVNYRPISILSYVDKILEKAVYSRVYNYLLKTNFFCINQFGFRANHCTEHAVLSLMDRLYEYINSKEYVILISLDLTKAFDVIKNLSLQVSAGRYLVGSNLTWITVSIELR